MRRRAFTPTAMDPKDISWFLRYQKAVAKLERISWNFPEFRIKGGIF